MKLVMDDKIWFRRFVENSISLLCRNPLGDLGKLLLNETLD